MKGEKYFAYVTIENKYGKEIREIEKNSTTI
jgi:hypothetical protein